MSPEDEGTPTSGMSNSPNLASATWPSTSGLSPTTVRKQPPSPLAISTSLNPSAHLSASLSVSGHSRDSIESSRSDFTSLRSDLTSFHISEFPLPPSILPTIPASPSTPKSLLFTSTFPKSGNITLESSDPLSRSLLPSPKTLKGFFTRSRDSSQTRLVPEPQLQHQSSEQSECSPSNSNHYHPSRKEAAFQHSNSRAPTPTTAGTMTPREWQSDSSRRSSLLKNDVSIRSEGILHPSSPEMETISAPSPPPQLPLPITPTNRSSFRGSLRYSQIIHQVVNHDRELHITEEKLLSTDFITEMLGQPTQSTSLQGAMTSEQKDHHGRSGIQASTPSGLTVIEETGCLRSPLLSASMHSPNMPENEVQIDRINSVLASSVFPSGGDMIYYDSMIASPSDMSPERFSGHKLDDGPHPLIPSPSTPLSPSSDPSANVKSLLDNPSSPSSSITITPVDKKNSSENQMAIRLPIGRVNSTSSTVSTQRSIKRTKVRQHRYPKSISTKTSPNSPESMPMQEFSNVSPIALENSVSAIMAFQGQNPDANGQSSSDVTGLYYAFENARNDDRRGTIVSVDASAHSRATSTKTQRDSIPVIPTLENLYDFTDSYSQKSSLVPPRSARSVRTRESAFDESDIYVGIAKTVNVPTELEPDVVTRSTSPKIIGVAPARIIQSSRLGSSGSLSHASSLQPLYIADQKDQKSGTDSGNPPVSPASPRNPPSHHTDIPESAKSLVFSDEMDDVRQLNYLPYEHRSSGGAYWTMFPGMGNNPPVQESRSIKTNAAASFKSIVSYITSKSAGKSSYKSTSNRSSKWTWLLRKPLPPLPPEAQDSGPSNIVHNPTPLALHVPFEKSKLSPPPLSGALTAWDYAKVEKRAAGVSNTMGRMLGEDSLKIAKRKPSRKGDDPYNGEITPYVLPHLTGIHRRQSSTSVHLPTLKARRRKVLIAGALVVLIVLVVIIVLAAVLSRKKHSATSSCSGANIGTFCNLDATCTCPNNQSGTCTAPLAKALSEIVPQTAQLFNVNITADALAIILWEQNGTPVNSDCLAQAELLDLGSGINPSSSPNRTQWAQSALAWNLFETASVNSTKQLQARISLLPFTQLPTDGIAPDSTGLYTVSTPGYILDFANQTVAPLPSKFASDAAPSAQQLSEINPSLEALLDRMYSFAIASSTQSQAALSLYWQNILSLNVADLPNFLSALRSSAIMLPFDATFTSGSNSIRGFLSHSNQSVSFPVPIACYPGLSDTQISSINLVETQAFGLSPINSGTTDFDQNCFINRPVYGVLDVWRLRLPFPDSRQGVAQQAAVLDNSGVSVRAILHAGELLSAFPGPNATDIEPFDVNPRDFGTLSHIQHVALEWLQSFPSVNLAVAAATYLSQSPTSPPPPSSGLLNATIPVIEVALFGEVLIETDISSFVSGLLTPLGELFFGSPQGEVFRRWALQSPSPSTITWTNSAIAQQVVIETQAVNSNFESVWTSAGTLIASGPTNSSSVQRILNAFNALGLLSG